MASQIIYKKWDLATRGTVATPETLVGPVNEAYIWRLPVAALSKDPQGFDSFVKESDVSGRTTQSQAYQQMWQMAFEIARRARDEKAYKGPTIELYLECVQAVDPMVDGTAEERWAIYQQQRRDNPHHCLFFPDEDIPVVEYRLWMFNTWPIVGDKDPPAERTSSVGRILSDIIKENKKLLHAHKTRPPSTDPRRNKFGPPPSPFAPCPLTCAPGNTNSC